jgi:tRNA A37 methylthiotransferase MiaB
MEVEVLVESYSEKNGGIQLRGRTRGNHVVNFSGDMSLVGSFVNVFIEHACNHSLSGRLAG